MGREIIKNIDDTYSVSSEGRFFKNGKERKGWINRKGYVWVCMHNKKYSLHRLVAFAFPEICGEWFEGAQVDHINTARDDNRAANLRFVSPKGNSNNPLTRQHLSEAQKGNKAFLGKHHTEESKKKISEALKGIPNLKLSKPVLQFSKSGELIKEWNSVSEIERELGYRQGNISMCCLNKSGSSYGFIWKYKEIN